MKKNNKGLTLVELIVSIAILSLVGIAVGIVINQSLRQYRMSNTEVSLQQEAQLVGNQLTNLVIDANDGVSAETGKLNIYDYDLATARRDKVVIALDETNGKLTYTRYEMADGDEDWTSVAGETEEFFADYVKEFSVMLLDEAGDEITENADEGNKDVHQVCIKIRYELQGKGYDYEQTITMRNQILASNIVAGDFDDEEDPEDPETPQNPENTETPETPENPETPVNPENPVTPPQETETPENTENSPQEPSEREPVVSGISVNVPDGNTYTRTTTATIVLTGENLPTDDISGILSGLSITAWEKKSSWWPWYDSYWAEEPSGITIAWESVTASETQYTITYTVTLSQRYQEAYTSRGCLKIQANYEDLEAEDTFRFGSSR